MSSDNDMMAAVVNVAEIWTLNDDRRTVKLRLPPLPLDGLPEPLRVTIDFEADMVEEMINRLTVLRDQMLPLQQH